jgi:hypothetical protein
MSESSETEEPGNGEGIDGLLDMLSSEPDSDQETDGLLDVLSSPLDNGDRLTAALARRPRAKLPSLTVVLVVVAIASAGFIGGILVGKHYGSSSSGGVASRFGAFAAAAGASSSAGTGTGTRAGFGGAGGGFAGAGGGTGGFAGGSATVGTIKLVDGKTVYVQTSAGDIVQVSTSAGTRVTVSSSVPVKDLEPGETVIVEGSKNSSGGVSATSISQTSLAAGAGG